MGIFTTAAFCILQAVQAGQKRGWEGNLSALLILTPRWFLTSNFLRKVLALLMENQLHLTPTSASLTPAISGVFLRIITKKNILSLVRYLVDFGFLLFWLLDFNLVNRSLPWDYAFRFVIEEISNINDKSQVRSLINSSLYSSHFSSFSRPCPSPCTLLSPGWSQDCK